MSANERSLRPEELNLITKLIRKSLDGDRLIPQLSSIRVAEMTDGGMGSSKFLGRTTPSRFGQQVGQLEFTDLHGVHASAALNVDQDGALYEVNVFKAGFSPLKSFPE